MVGITLLVDLWRKKQSFNMAHSYPSSWFFSASATAATLSVGASFASNDFFGFRTPIAYSDSGVLAVSDDYLSGVRTSPGKYFYHDTLKYSPKGYNFELKPLWSAFELRSFALISLRSFLMFYLPLLEPHANMEQDYDNFMQDKHDELHGKLVVPFKKSLLQIVREITVVTTRRVLERLTFHYASRKMAWRLLKDVPASAVRKAGRGMPTYMYMLSVSKATLRGHTIGVTASWIVQVGVRIFQFFKTKSINEDGSINKAERNRIFKEKIYIATLKCNASLVFAAIGGGIGATLCRPSVGQWIGCAVGDLTGPVIVAVIANRTLDWNL
ncbi:unnamed protein product [Lathyrus oleraceus]|uniref:Uncharacterized protein n=1 Tax=Pisum sativum TaxID=3888 RepID=A0A9D4VRE6_PEA|nr:uncharacterized protein LOC127106825 [Pisum sativum]XP_050900077.1 uncharacterized protein LOC127106825 [Pisum sativum]KAI5388843.1 hypothetical protein KIW84_074485 [Pisum sativum]